MYCRMVHYLLVLAFIILTGCAGAYMEPPMNETHPANPAAPAAELPATSGVLSLAATQPTSDASEIPPAEGHSQHGASSSSDSAATQPDAAVYVCPMHPKVVSSKPGHCPICNMKLVRKSGTGVQP